MLKIINNEIRINRGDKGNIPFQIPLNEEGTELYQFQAGDKVTFGVYKKKGFDECALILKEVEITEVTDTCMIPLTSEDTKIGELINEPKEYWYEISLNGDETVVGYDDEDGEKIFLLFPEGSGTKC